MAFSRLIFLITLSFACIVQNVSCNQVPVFLWGDLSTGKVRSNPLSKLSTSEFEALVKQEIENDPFTVIFMEETLSVEDISQKNEDGEVSFPYLQSIIGKAIYLPSVESPLTALNELANPEGVDHVKLTENGLSAEIESNSDKFMVIDLKDATEGESRSDLLRKHNDFMENMYKKLVEKYGKVVAVYTARFPSWTVLEKHSRVRRATNSRGSFALTNLLMYYKELILQSDNTTTVLPDPTDRSNVINGTSIEATLVFPNQTIRLYFTLKSGYWYFNEVSITDSAGVTEELQVVSDNANGIYALDNFSYRCGSGASFVTVNATKAYTIRFVNLKVQPFFGNTTNDTLVYGESFNCAGFFSAPIWSGLFVSFVLLAITFYGIMMMMDIKTNDRFDDPKGKTITVSALEG